MSRKLDWEKIHRNELKSKAGVARAGEEINSAEEGKLQAWWADKARPSHRSVGQRKKPAALKRKSGLTHDQRVARAQAKAARKIERLAEALRLADSADKAEVAKRLAKFKAKAAKRSARAAAQAAKHKKWRLGPVQSKGKHIR